MVRSMYSGVSGMRAHQTRMDTIGNNIANVNTNGFKSSRVTFRDIYYQNVRGASAASASKGGVNPSQVGVGSQVSSIDVLQTRSTFMQTDYAMDVAIDGEGFLQIQDADGNKYYTRAGQLNFDAAGNLVDSKGNFVLGTLGNPVGKTPSSELIQVALPASSAKNAAAEVEIQGVKYTINTTNATKDGNIGVQFTLGKDMALDEKVKAEVGPYGIVVYVNPNAQLTASELSTEMDAAIQAASRKTLGKEHPAGTFSITADPNNNVSLSGTDWCSSDFSPTLGTMTGWNTGMLGGFKFSGVSEKFTAGAALVPPAVSNGATEFSVKKGAAATDDWTVEMVVGGTTYTGVLPPNTDAAGKMRLYNGAGSDDYIEVAYPKPSTVDWTQAPATSTEGAWVPTGTAPNFTGFTFTPNLTGAAGTPSVWQMTPSTASTAQGLASKKFSLTGGNEGGPRGIENLTNLQIGTDGVIIGESEGETFYIGRVDLVSFGNPQGLSADGGTYFTESANSGEKSTSAPGTMGCGQLVSGSLELSNVDLSREFSDMISTQRGYQANSRIITVSDTMLEELVNLKR